MFTQVSCLLCSMGFIIVGKCTGFWNGCFEFLYSVVDSNHSIPCIYMHMSIVYALFCKQISASKPLNAIWERRSNATAHWGGISMLLPHESNDVMLRITSLLLTVDFAVSLLDNHILSPLLMVMSLAVTADTDMMTVLFRFYKLLWETLTRMQLAQLLAEISVTLCWWSNVFHCWSCVTVLLLCITIWMTRSACWWQIHSQIFNKKLAYPDWEW